MEQEGNILFFTNAIYNDINILVPSVLNCNQRNFCENFSHERSWSQFHIFSSFQSPRIKCSIHERTWK